ncbi:ABC transporter ATP-binding protein [Bacillus sp. B-jedd]|uniref:ABC transporter ATP-binding protein n=1 Tax=Bacillus sp. B-jedd TaxID=1476857 RepID=UPI0005155448|nr:ABC transporter ATP-binding protein [Bacillus sp. B-jedd]CEG29391.1 multidrug resistance ABC transporter ATP-binding/permease BmrA [Bacillus sp. B-jedd]
MQEETTHSYKEFFGLIFKSKLPWHLYLFGFIAMIASTTLSLQMPVVTSKIMEGKIFDMDIVFKYIGLSAAAFGLASVSAFFVAVTAPAAKRSLQKAIWPKMIRMPMSQYNKQPSQQLISRVTIDTGFIDSVISDFKSLLNASYGIFGSFAIMYSMNAKLTLALLPVVPYILIVTVVVGKYTQKTQSRVQGQFSGVTAFFAERLPRVRLIKSFGKEHEEIAKGHDCLKEQYAAEKKRAFVDLFAEPLRSSTQAIIQGTTLVYGSYLIRNGELKVSEVIAFFMYVAFIHNGVLQYSLFWNNLKQAKGASDKIATILNTPSEGLERKTSFKNSFEKDEGKIKLENVSFSYENKTVLSNINLTIPKGKLTAIVGPSGGGKSTIFSLLERFYEPNVGRILVNNTPAEEIHLDEWRKSIAYVSQTSPLLSGTIRDNITYGIDRAVSDEEVWEAAVQADALDFIQEFPDGFHTEVGEFGSKLSGGQRQRIAIARALIKDPEILLLDEAMASLDARSEHEIEKSFKEIMSGRTTIMIAHDLNTVKDADQIIVIDSGKVSGVGTHKELLESTSIYKKLVEIQAEKDAKLGAISFQEV